MLEDGAPFSILREYLRITRPTCIVQKKKNKKNKRTVPIGSKRENILHQIPQFKSKI